MPEEVTQLQSLFFSLAAAVSISLRAWANLVARPAAAAAAGQNATSNVAHLHHNFPKRGRQHCVNCRFKHQHVFLYYYSLSMVHLLYVSVYF
jgi:hypothetical protein